MKNKNLKKYFSLFFALLCFVQGMIALPDASAQISRQPYLQKLTTSSVLVAWRSSSSQAFELRYGSTPNMLTNSLTSPASTEHGVDIVGLAAYTQYFYQIFDANGNALSEAEHFYTAKPDTEKDANMLVFGDCGVANNNQYAIRDLMLNEANNNGFDFGIVCGDVSQGNGTEYDNLYFSVYQDILPNYCFYPAIGNHDLYGYPFDNGTAQQFLADFYQPTNNPAGTEEYYSFEYANVKAICLHVNFEEDYAIGSAQYEWLVAELECRTTDWVFVYFHQPPYANGWDISWFFNQYDGEDGVRNTLVPLFEQYNVDFVFNGHMHGYERGQKNGIYYVTSGGGGGNLDSKKNNWSHISVENYIHHYLIVDVTGSTLEVTAIDVNNNIVDNFTKTKEPSALVAAFELPANICDTADPVNLNDFLHPNATSGGTWSGEGVANDMFTPDALTGEIAITYDLGNEPCSKTAVRTITIENCSITVKAKVFLEAVYNAETNEMHTDLRTNDLLPISQPFNRSPWLYEGNEDVNDISEISADAVDWVLVEARNATTAELIETRAGFLLKDGRIADVNGSTDGINFRTLTANTPYYLVIRTRNHLATASATTVSLPNATAYDFTTAVTQAYGSNQMTEIEADVFAQLAGDFDSNGMFTYADFNAYISEASAINEYLDGDVNMDGQISVEDFNWYLPNVSRQGIDVIRY